MTETMTAGALESLVLRECTTYREHWATGGNRDFGSVSQLRAKRYTVQVDAGYLQDAKKIADRM
jgi:hypothetical protein